MAEPRVDSRIVSKAFERARADFDPLFELAEEGQQYILVVVGYCLEQLRRIIDELLEESETLLERNPSASLVWSAQGFEVFAKEGLCRPALFHRMGWDADASRKFFEEFFERNGAKLASEFIGPLLKINTNDLPMWSALVAKDTGVLSRRNKIVHEALKVSHEEAKNAIDAVKGFVNAISTRCVEEIESLKTIFEHPKAL